MNFFFIFSEQILIKLINFNPKNISRNENKISYHRHLPTRRVPQIPKDTNCKYLRSTIINSQENNHLKSKFFLPFYCRKSFLPYPDDSLEILFDSAVHVLVEVELWVRPTVILEDTVDENPIS